MSDRTPPESERDLPAQEVERFELGGFGAQVRRYRESNLLSLRRAAEVAGVSVSTLTRVESGSQPDLTSFTALCAWMGVAPSDFFVPVAERETSSIDDIIAHLRHDPLLSEEASGSIAALLKAMYDQLALPPEPERLVACHLRAATTLRQGVPERLSSLLTDIQHELTARVASGQL